MGRWSRAERNSNKTRRLTLSRIRMRQYRRHPSWRSTLFTLLCAFSTPHSQLACKRHKRCHGRGYKSKELDTYSGLAQLDFCISQHSKDNENVFCDLRTRQKYLVAGNARYEPLYKQDAAKKATADRVAGLVS